MRDHWVPDSNYVRLFPYSKEPDADSVSQDIWHHRAADVSVLSSVPKGQRSVEVSGEAHVSTIAYIPGADCFHPPRSAVCGT